MALTVGQLVAYLKVDKGNYSRDMADAKKQASGVGDELEKSEQRGSKALRGLGATARSVLPALTVGAVIAAGWNRFTGIENAEAKLKGLGHTAGDVKAIMGDALASVKGTAFGLDEAASIAATATAAGISTGKELQSTLKLVADTAAITGSSMGEMGSVFNKIAANGKLTTETMLQLQDRGIPVLIKLAEQYGVTSAEAQKMVTQGKVSFTDFANVMQGTVGGAALQMGETTTGTLKNVGAALSRVGADILTGIMPTIKMLADGLIVVADGFGKLPGPVKAATVVMAAFIALEKAGLFAKLGSAASGLVTQLRLIKTEGIAASGALGKIGKVGAIGIATAAVTLLVKSWQDYNTAMVDANQLVDINTGKLNENAKATVATTLAQKDYLGIAQRAGLNQGELSDAILKGGAAYDDVIAKIKNYQQVLADNTTYKAGASMFQPDSADEKQARADLEIYFAFLHDVELQRKRVADAERQGAAAAAESAASTQVATGAMERYVAQLMNQRVALNSTAVSTGKATAGLDRYIGFLETRGIQAQKDLADAARDAAAAVDEANVAYNRSAVGLAGASYDATEALVEAQRAAQKTGRAVLDSSGNFDLSQASVRDAVTSLYGYRDAALDSISALYKQTAATDGAAAAQQAAQGAALDARQGFIDMATSILGVSVPAAQTIANQLGFLQGIRIDDKTFTVTMVRRTVDVAVAEGQYGDSWMRKINQDAAAAAQQATDGFKMPSLQDLIGAVPAPKASGGGGGGKSGAQRAAEKAAADAQRAAEKAQREAEKRAEEAARREQKRQEDMARTVSGAFDRIGKSVQKPFDIMQVGLQGVVAQISGSGRSLANAVAKGLDPRQAKALQDQLVSAAVEAGKQFKAMQQQIRGEDFDALRKSLSGTVSDVQSSVATLIKDLRAVGATSGTIAQITATERDLTDAMTRRQQVVTRLADAQQQLNSVTQAYDQRVSSVVSSMQQFANISNLTGGKELTGFDASSLITSMQERASVASQFAADITKLRSMGLNDTTLQQLIDAGPSAATQIAALASATGAQIAQVNALADKVFGTGSQLGKLSAESMYRQGINAAQSLVNGLTSQQQQLTDTINRLGSNIEIIAETDMRMQGQRAMDGLIAGLKSKDSELNKAMVGIGASMVASFKKALGIHSPSKVMADEVGVPVIDGIAVGMQSRLKSLDSTAVAVTGSLAGVAVSSRPGVAGSGPLELVLTIAGDGPLSQAIAAGARVEVKAAQHQEQVRVNQGGVR